MSVCLAGHRLLFVNIYAPNTDDPDFFCDLHALFDRNASDHILGGDLNLLLDPALGLQDHMPGDEAPLLTDFLRHMRYPLTPRYLPAATLYCAFLYILLHTS